MHAETDNQPQARLSGLNHPLARLLAVFFWVTLAAYIVVKFDNSSSGENIIWIANGLLLAVLLLAPRWRWVSYSAAGYAALVLSGYLTGAAWGRNFELHFLDMVEVLTAALLLRRRSTDLPQFTSPWYLLRFTAFAVILGPVVPCLIFYAINIFQGQPTTTILRSMLDWVRIDGLGLAITTPTCVAVLRLRYRDEINWGRHLAFMIAFIVATLALFSQQYQQPLLFLLYPLLVMLLLQTSLGWAALATIFVAIVGGSFTLHHMGPLGSDTNLTTVQRSVYLQCFIAGAMFMLYAISVVMENLHNNEKSLQRSLSMYSLVTENSRDSIVLSDIDGLRTYVSPAVIKMLGWEPKELIGHEITEIAHPDDRPTLQKLMQEMRVGSGESRMQYRARRKDGSYIWVEVSMRLYRDQATQLPAGVLSMMRDISERKQAEQQLQQAYKEAEALAVEDPLTGVANRRRFDEVLDEEWRRAMRSKLPISLLLVDADFFKNYNDTYGHLRGDSCLRQLAEAALMWWCGPAIWWHAMGVKSSPSFCPTPMHMAPARLLKKFARLFAAERFDTRQIYP